MLVKYYEREGNELLRREPGLTDVEAVEKITKETEAGKVVVVPYNGMKFAAVTSHNVAELPMWGMWSGGSRLASLSCLL